MNNTIKIYLASSGAVATLDKDFPLYQYQYQDKLLEVYIPISILGVDFNATKNDVMQNEYINGTAVKVGVLSTTPSGIAVISQSRYLQYIKRVTKDNVEYALFTRLMPKEFTYYNGVGTNAPKIIIDVINIDVETNTIKEIVTSQQVSMDVMSSSLLDNEEPIQASELENVNSQLSAIWKVLTDKQDITDENLQTTNKTIVGAINENLDYIKINKDNINTNNNQIQANTTLINKNTQDIADLTNIVSTGENFIGTLTVQDDLPTDIALNNFVYNTIGRQPQKNDVVIVIVKLNNETDKNFKYFYTIENTWSYYEIPPMEKASNNDYGILKGGDNSKNDLNVNIVDGVIEDIYIATSDIAKVNLVQQVNSNKSDTEGNIRMIYDIMQGNVSVGKANEAKRDAYGNAINETYITKENGATKKFVQDYALPRNFNDVYYYTTNNGVDGYSTEIQEREKTTEISSVGEIKLFSGILNNGDKVFDLGNKNSFTSKFYVGISINSISTQFKLVTEIRENEGAEWKTANIDLSTRYTLTPNEIVLISFNNVFNDLNEVVKMGENNQIRQTLYMVSEDSSNNEITLYFNDTYQSTFTLNTNTQTIYTQSGLLGEIPIYNLKATEYNGQDETIYFESESSVNLSNNSICKLILSLDYNDINSQGGDLDYYYNKVALRLNNQIFNIIGFVNDDYIAKYDDILDSVYKVIDLRRLCNYLEYSTDTTRLISFKVELICVLSLQSNGGGKFRHISQVYRPVNYSNNSYPYNPFIEYGLVRGGTKMTDSNCSVDYKDGIVTNIKIYDTNDTSYELADKIFDIEKNMYLVAPKQIILGANGIYENDRYTFTVDNPDINYRTNLTEFLVDLHLQLVGELDESAFIEITYSDETYSLYNLIDNMQLTMGDIIDMSSYSEDIGYRFVFNATFIQNSDIVGFGIIPTASNSGGGGGETAEVLVDNATITKNTENQLTLSEDVKNALMVEWEE